MKKFRQKITAPMRSSFDSPIKLFFDMSWQKWRSLSEISDNEKLNFQAAFVEAIADETHEHFVRFGTVKYIFNSRELVNKISQKYDPEADELLMRLGIAIS